MRPSLSDIWQSRLINSVRVVGELTGLKQILGFCVPRMAVAAYFPFDGKSVNGTIHNWNWAMDQWDKVAAAGSAVRLVVADQAYSNNLSTQSEIDNIKQKFKQCQNAGQLVFGYVHGRNGRIPLGLTGQKYKDPPRLDAAQTEWAVMRDQIDQWYKLYKNLNADYLALWEQGV